MAIWLGAALWAQTIACSARAADNLFADAVVLDPSRLVELVLERNPDLEAAHASATEAAARVRPAGSLEDPMVSYMIAPATVGARDIGTREGVEVSQAFPWLGTLAARKARASAEAEAAEGEASLRTLEVIAQAKAAFAEWAFVHAAIDVNRRHQAVLRDLEAATEQSYAAGVALQMDALKAGLELVQVENEALFLESERQATQARINALLNREPDASLPKPAPLPTVVPLPTLSRIKDVALFRHPQVKQMQAMVKANEAGVRLARKAFYPDLSVEAGYNEMWDMREMRTSVGLSITVPLQWGRRKAELDGARAAHRRAEWALVAAKAAVLAAVAEAHARLVQTGRSVELHKTKLLPITDATLASALSAYRAGKGDFIAVIEADRAKFDRMLSLERALAEQYRALADLEKAVGGSLADLPTLPASDTGAEESPLEAHP